MGKNKKKHVQESKSATASATIPTTNSEAVKNPKAGQDRLTKAVFKQVISLFKLFIRGLTFLSALVKFRSAWGKSIINIIQYTMIHLNFF